MLEILLLNVLHIFLRKFFLVQYRNFLYSFHNFSIKTFLAEIHEFICFAHAPLTESEKAPCTVEMMIILNMYVNNRS